MTAKLRLVMVFTTANFHVLDNALQLWCT